MLRLAILLLFTVALAGCFGGDDGEPSPTTPATTNGPSTPNGTSDPSPTGDPGNGSQDPGNGTRDPVTWQVEVQDNSFSPATLDVQVGDTVEWVRVGNNPHTVTADDGSFHSGDCPGTDCFLPAAGRQSFSWTFDTAGDAAYYCEIHGGAGGSGMSGVVSVLEQYDGVPS